MRHVQQIGDWASKRNRQNKKQCNYQCDNESDMKARHATFLAFRQHNRVLVFGSGKQSGNAANGQENVQGAKVVGRVEARENGVNGKAHHLRYNIGS